jgi:hypothetical protein
LSPAEQLADAFEARDFPAALKVLEKFATDCYGNLGAESADAIGILADCIDLRGKLIRLEDSDRSAGLSEAATFAREMATRLRSAPPPSTLKPCAEWKNDCQGKKDFDGPILSVSTRYWPGPGRPSATTSIYLNIGPPGADVDDIIWRQRDFEADTEAEVKAAVESWVSEMMAIVARRLVIR